MTAIVTGSTCLPALEPAERRGVESSHEVLGVFEDVARMLADAACVCAEVFTVTLQGLDVCALSSARVAVLSHVTAQVIVAPSAAVEVHDISTNWPSGSLRSML